jgi:hypothetical protein
MPMPQRSRLALNCLHSATPHPTLALALVGAVRWRVAGGPHARRQRQRQPTIYNIIAQSANRISHRVRGARVPYAVRCAYVRCSS